MQKAPGNQGTDIISELLEDCLMAFPVSSLLISFYKQYQKRGFLTKKQLQGLYGKASGVSGINQGRLATLEAIIKKMPDRFKSEKPESKPLYEKDEETGSMLTAILVNYPQHKRVLYLKAKYDNNEPLSVSECDEVRKFHRLLNKPL